MTNSPLTVSAVQIEVVTKEWKDKQTKKDSDTQKEQEGSNPPAVAKSPSPQPQASPTPALEKFTLHKDVFRMRVENWNRKRANNRAAQIPSTPRSSFR